MCRMMAAVGPFDEAAPFVLRFRDEAFRGKRLLLDKDGHRDGWGIVAGEPPAHAGRSVLDASADPSYPEAAARLARRGRGVSLVHLRAASMGAVDVENAHPFLGDGYAFCHNGTIHGLEGPGGSDSRGYFADVLAEIRSGLAPADALAAVASRLAKTHAYSSLTCLLTDGRTLWGLRKVGDGPQECADKACAADYYTLGVARAGGLTLVAQERDALPEGVEWDVVPDGFLLTVAPDGGWSTRRALTDA